MSRFEFCLRGLAALSLLVALPAGAQSFRVQCPTSTITHPDPTTTSVVSLPNSGNPYKGPTAYTLNGAGFQSPTAGTVNGGIKCQQISGGDGLATMADGTQTFMFSFGPLSGLADIAAGRTDGGWSANAGTEVPSIFNTSYGTLSATGTTNVVLQPGDPATTDGAMDAPYTQGTPTFNYNGAVGLINHVSSAVTIASLIEGALPPPATAGACPTPTANTVTVYSLTPSGLAVGAQVVIANDGSSTTPAGYLGTWNVTAMCGNVTTADGTFGYAFQYLDTAAGVPVTGLAPVIPGVGTDGGLASAVPGLDGHVDPRQIMDVGVMNGNIPAPLMAFDEDDEFFLTLTNVGMIMRPDLFEQHTVHFHGYPNASSFYDGVPDASVAINIGGSFTYYYLAPDAGTYFWHCHITPPEHLQMGMVGQLYVRPRQDRAPTGTSLYLVAQLQNGTAPGQGGTSPTIPTDLRTACYPSADILCSAVTPAVNNGATQKQYPATVDYLTSTAGTTTGAAHPNAGRNYMYTYNDGDGSTQYDVEYPIQMHGFDPNFHFVGMTFNPEAFVDMKSKYFLLNGRSYPDTSQAGPQLTQTTDNRVHYSQPMPTVINIPQGGKALLRLVNLAVDEYHTLASLGIRMHVVGWNAKLLRDQEGNNTEYYANSITLGGGESLDAILDTCQNRVNFDSCTGAIGTVAATPVPKGTYYLYTPNLDHLSNDAENFGGMMAEVHVY